MDIKIVHGYRYITPRQTVQMIKKVPHVCSTKSYLECVTTWHEVEHVCRLFSEELRAPELKDPDIFLKVFDNDHNLENEKI